MTQTFPEVAKTNVKRGFSYFVDDAKRRRYYKLSPTEKLQWLADAGDFIARIATPRTKELHTLFREGRI